MNSVFKGVDSLAFNSDAVELQMEITEIQKNKNGVWNIKYGRKFFFFFGLKRSMSCPGNSDYSLLPTGTN